MRLESALRAIGAQPIEELPRNSRWALQKQWRRKFAGAWHDWSGPLLEMDWHVFSYRYVMHMERAEAMAAFDAQSEVDLIVSSNLSQGPTFKCAFRNKPDYMAFRSAWAGDLYLMNMTLDWTFVLTHEQDLGPHFVQSSDNSERAT